MRGFAAAYRLQLRMIFADFEYLMPLVTVPMFTIIFLAILEHSGRVDLSAYALIAPVLIALWALSIYTSGEIIDDDRWAGVLEAVVAAPANFGFIVLARVLAVTTVAMLAIPEVLFVGRVLFGVDVAVHHPMALIATFAATAFAMSATAVAMAALFVLTRNVRTIQNAITYPFYVVGGILVPVAFLPDWLEPVTRVVFLSWSADLLRDALEAAPVDDLPLRLGAVLALACVGFAGGLAALRSVLRRVRVTGTMTSV